MKILQAMVVVVVAACTPHPRTSVAERMLGERAFQKCYSCHALQPGQNGLSGPTLYRIVGRSIAAEPGFDYSPAMRRFAATERNWGNGLLDKFIADPESLVPGTSMNFHGIDDADERQALIAYLDSQTSASADNLP